MPLNLENRNCTGVLIGYVKYKDENHFCLADVEYWIAEWWNGYVNLNDGSLEMLYFDYLKQFKLNYSELKKAYSELIPKNDPFDIEGNKPKLYVDFNKKYLKSNFFDQELERRVPESWTGEYGEVLSLINQEHVYWK